jgi:hypothetical protein
MRIALLLMLPACFYDVQHRRSACPRKESIALQAISVGKRGAEALKRPGL